MTFSHALSTNNYGPAKFIVASSAANGTHTTIASALTSASSGDTIFIRPGTYTENLTLKAGVNLAAYDCDALNGNVTIVGKATFTAAGTVDISGIRLQTNSDFFLAVTGTLASIVNLKSCYLNATNNTGISFTTSSSSAEINVIDCLGDIGTTGIALFSMSSAGTLSYTHSNMTNSGLSTTASTISAGLMGGRFARFASAITSSGTGAVVFNSCILDTLAIATTALTHGGSGAGSRVGESVVLSGTASCISVGAGATLTVINTEITSSNANVITGVGTLSYGGVTFSGPSSTINTTTRNPIALSVFQGGTGLTSTTSQQILYSSATNTIAGLASANSAIAATNSSGTLAMRALSVVIQTFTTNDTYTPTSGMLYCIIEVVGGGGGGGGAATTGATTISGAGGGGGGGYARKVVSAATIGASQSVTVGTGGGGGSAGNNNGTGGNTTSVGAIVSATGGSGGAGSAAASSAGAAGGAGGAGSSGSFNISGQPGGNGIGAVSSGILSFAQGGCGGCSCLGGGAVGSIAAAGGSGSSYGGGGSGGSRNISTTQVAGGSGANGIVIITEFVIS